MKKRYMILGLIPLIIVIIVLFLGFNNINSNFDLDEQGSDFMSVGVYKVKTDSIAKYITASSNITSFNISEIELNDSEEVKDIYIKDGSTVKKNQKLLKVSDGSYYTRYIKAEVPGKFFVIHEEDGSKKYRIYDTNTTGIIVKINENNIKNIKVGEKAKVSLINSDEEYTGKISFVSKIPNSEGKFNVEISIPYEKNIKYGYSANVKIEADSNNSTIVIPYEAINIDDVTGKYYVVEEEYKSYFETNTLTEDMKIYIETGIFEVDNVEVKSGLEEGMKILYWK